MGKEGTKEKLDIELEAPADFTSPEVLYQDLVKTFHDRKGIQGRCRST